jgi:hypothetical protein
LQEAEVAIIRIRIRIRISRLLSSEISATQSEIISHKFVQHERWLLLQRQTASAETAEAFFFPFALQMPGGG